MNLTTHTFDGAADGPHLLILAGIHGDEFEPMVAANRLARFLHTNPPVRGRVTLVPVANPSARQRKARCGEDDLDLARTFPGRADGSVTQRLASDLAEKIHSADYLIDMHTGGVRYLVWPLAGYLMHHDESILSAQRIMARAFNLPVVWGTDASVEGRSLSIARDGGKPAIYIEYLGALPFQRAAVGAMFNGCLQTMAALRIIEREISVDRIRYWAEDARAGTGHLQASHPAPYAGKFVPEVELGQQVEAGQLLGLLNCDSISSAIKIVAQHSGRVVCLHSSKPAEGGEGLAVIVDFCKTESYLI